MTEDREADDTAARACGQPERTPLLPPPREKIYDRDSDPVEFGRLVALTDGVFAIALTLLVLDLALPAAAADVPLATALSDLVPQLWAFVISVAVVGTFFHSHHELVSMLQRFDATLMGLIIPFLGFVVLIPFAQGILGEREEPLAYALYAALLGAVAAVEALMYWHAHRHGLLRFSLRGRVGRIQALREALPVVMFFTSAGLAFVVGSWTVLLWLATWPIDSVLVRVRAGRWADMT